MPKKNGGGGRAQKIPTKAKPKIKNPILRYQHHKSDDPDEAICPDGYYWNPKLGRCIVIKDRVKIG